jgi:hypothetical protein
LEKSLISKKRLKENEKGQRKMDKTGTCTRGRPSMPPKQI